MPDFKCKCSPEEVKTVNVCTIRFIDGKWLNDVFCDKCGAHMEQDTSKIKYGLPNFSSNKYGQL